MRPTRPRDERPRCEPAPDGSCAICADEAIRGRVVAVDAAARMAEVELGGAPRTIALDLVEGVRVGDAVMVQMGFAIARVEEP